MNHTVTVYCPACGQPVTVPFRVRDVTVYSGTLTVTLAASDGGKHSCRNVPQDAP